MGDKKAKRAAYGFGWFLCGAAGAVCFLFLVGGIAALLALFVPSSKDVNTIKKSTNWIHEATNTTEDLIIDIYNNTVPVEDSSCDDGNMCTFDGLLNETCHNWNLPNDSNCTSECYSSPSCQAGQCTGTCLGTCDIDADCIDIQDVLGNNLTVTCLDSVCTYNATGSIESFIQANPCYMDDFDDAKCLAAIEENPYRDCLTAHPTCTTQSPSDLTCLFTFSCAEPEYLLL